MFTKNGVNHRIASQLPRVLVLFFILFVTGCALFRDPYTGADEMEVERFKRTQLPLKTTQVFEVKQGPFGKSSHNETGNEYSWDFAVPYGTDVIAVEAGTVIDIYRKEPENGSPTAGCDPKFEVYAANIKVEHMDGTVAQYVHIEPLIAKGSHVTAGQVIARTAENGWLCYPHLHFGIYKSRNHLYDSPARETIPLYFEQIPGGILKEGFKLTDQF